MDKTLDARPNKVFLNDHGMLELVFYGNQPAEKVRQMLAEEDVIIAQLTREGKPVNVLANAEQVGKMTSDGRKLAVQYVKAQPFRRIAVYGGGTFMRTVASMVIRALGRRDIRVFGTREPALKWLLEDSPP